MYHQFNIQQFYVRPHTVYLCVLCGSENKQRLFPYTTLTGWFCNQAGMCLLRGTDWLFIIQFNLSTCISRMSFEGDVLRTARRSASVPLQADPWPVRTNVNGQSIYSDTMININTWRLSVCLKVINCNVRFKLDTALPALQGAAEWRRVFLY